jgi:Holliday junction resolvase
MAETPEGRVKRKIKDILKAFGTDVYYFMPAMGSFGKSGVPDIVACVYGEFVAIEVKADKQKNPPTALQTKNLTEIETARGLALVIDAEDLEALKRFLTTVVNRRKDMEKVVGGVIKGYVK